MSRHTKDEWLQRILIWRSPCGHYSIHVDPSGYVFTKFQHAFEIPRGIWDAPEIYDEAGWHPPVPAGMMDALREYIDLL